MAIPTQFSVTKKAKCPIANPDISQDLANTINAESIGFISGASSLPSKKPSETGAAVVIDSEYIPEQDLAFIVNSESIPEQDSAVVIDSGDSPEQDSAVVINSESPPSQDDANALPVIPQPAQDNASAMSAQATATINDPSLVGSIAPSSISSPTFTIVDRIQYNFSNTLNDWAAVNATLSTGATAMSVQMTGSDLQLIKTDLPRV